MLSQVYFLFGRSKPVAADGIKAGEAPDTASAAAALTAPAAAATPAANTAVAASVVPVAAPAPAAPVAAVPASAVPAAVPTAAPAPVAANKRVEVRVVYGSTTGAARRFAATLAPEAPPHATFSASLGGDSGEGGSPPTIASAASAQQHVLAPLEVLKPMDCDGADAWDLLEPSAEAEAAADEGVETSLVVVVIMATWSGGTAPVLATR